MEEHNKTVGDVFYNKFLNLINDNSQFDVNFTRKTKFIKTISANMPQLLDPLSEQQNFDKKVVQNLTLFVTFSIVAALSLLINIRVFHIVFVTSKQKSRPANILVAHLSAVVIGLTCVVYRNILEKTNIFSLAAPGICSIFSLLGNIIYNVFSLNIGAIIWVRTRNDAVNLRKSCGYRAIGVMWAMTFFFNLPTIFMVKSNENPDTKVDYCKQIPLFGSLEATIVYEILRLLLFNIMVCVYLIRATVKVQSSIKFLQIPKLVQSERTLKRARQVRFVHLHTIVLLFTWFPHGLGIFLYKTLTRVGWPIDFVKYLTPLVFLNYVVFILCPLSYVILLEEMPLAKFFVPRFRNKSDITANGDENLEKFDPEIFGWRVNPPLKQKSTTKTAAKMQESNNSFDFMEKSWLTTVGVTGTSECISSSITRITPWRPCVQFERVSIPLPALLPPSTSVRLENVSVELHLEPEDPIIEHETEFGMRNIETLV